jgi:hypothetical protein
LAAGEEGEWWVRQWREVEQVGGSNEEEEEELEVEGVLNAGERLEVGGGPYGGIGPNKGVGPYGAISPYSGAEKKVDVPARTDGSNDEEMPKVERLRISEDPSDKSSDINSIESDLLDAFIEMGSVDSPRFSGEDTIRVISEEKEPEPTEAEVSESESPGEPEERRRRLSL